MNISFCTHHNSETIFGVLQQIEPIILFVKDLEKISTNFDRFANFKKEVDKLKGRIVVIACTFKFSQLFIIQLLSTQEREAKVAKDQIDLASFFRSPALVAMRLWSSWPFLNVSPEAKAERRKVVKP